MHFFDLMLPTLAENLALDEALLLEAEAGQGTEVLRLWEWPKLAVVLGSASRVAEDVHEAACLADEVPLARRASGGGTVLLGTGCLLYSLVLAYARDAVLKEVLPSHAYILERVRQALTDVLPEISPAGTSDLAAAGLKFSGNAQQRKRDFFLHHGTLLYDFDVASVGRYLKPPPRQPEYRRGRPHEVFMRNLPLSRAALATRLQQAWRAETKPTSWPAIRVHQLCADKYTRPEWTYRR